MAEIDRKTGIIEDYSLLLDLKVAYGKRDRPRFEQILEELSEELAADYKAKVREKVLRWGSATNILHFYDRPPARAYIQAKMLYRDGFYEATIMVARSIAEMICYDRLDGVAHSFGTTEQVEKKNFRDLIKWLSNNDRKITTDVFDDLNDLYDIGNNYIHPKSSQDAKSDSLKALNLVGKSVWEVYGVRSVSDMVGRFIRTPYVDFTDICSGKKFLLEISLTPDNQAIQRERKGD